MPAKARRAAAEPTPAAKEPDVPVSSQGTGLRFNEPLSWRAGRPIAVGELLRRLQSLSNELRDLEQEEVDREAFVHVAKELASQNLLAHKDRGVRAWTGHALVDILRLCAPDAPFTSAQLRDIFTLFVTSILPALSDPTNTYNSQHFYILSSLAQVKSIILLTDLPNSDPLLLHLFTSFFDILSGTSKASTGEQVAKNVEYHMTQILVVLVDESTSLPSEIVDIIVAQFLRADPRAATGGQQQKGKRNGVAPVDEKQSTLLMRELPPAYTMAKTICNTCPEKMARYISQYFNDVIMDSSAVTENAGQGHHHRRVSSHDQDVSDDELPAGPTEDDLKELHKAHQLVRELWRASPEVLQNVVPQLEAELSAENVRWRLLAMETLGDLASGIGAAGLPPPPPMDPAAYPPATLATYPSVNVSQSILTTPASPQPFPQVYAAAYGSFLSRKNDKSAVIRAAWTTSIGRILTTNGGGMGLTLGDEQSLIKDLARMLVDSDDRVRIAAIKAVGAFGFRDVVLKLGRDGGVSESGTVLSNLADRARDRKHGVRVEGMHVLGRIWGVAAGEIAAGNEEVTNVLGAIPSKIFAAFYANDVDVFLLLDQVVFQHLLPLSYPPIKTKSKVENGDGQKSNSQKEKDEGDADKIRAERILLLVKDLDDKAKKAFFAMQGRQVQVAKVMLTFLQRCENYNGGVMEGDEEQIKVHLGRLIDYLAKMLPDSSKVSADLWKFAKLHDRRNYQLIRFCMTPESDYRTVQKAIKELTKRIESGPSSGIALLDTLLPLLYRCSLLIFNKSQVPAIVEFSRTDDMGLGNTAHELLKEISTQTPEVFKAHVQELCRVVQEQAPTAQKPNDPGAVDTLKACASFARKFPKEIPRDRKFLQSLVSFAQAGTPAKAAKHAVSIMMASAERKEMYAKDLMSKSLKNFEFGSATFLARLATISQLILLTPKVVEEEWDAIMDIAINQVLLNVRTPSKAKEKDWVTEDELDDEGKAKLWALKILVNRVRSFPDPDSVQEASRPVYKVLYMLIEKDGEISKKQPTPAYHRSRLRLLAAQLYLKLCRHKVHEELLTPTAFDRLCLVAQDPIYNVRVGFVNTLKKYLGQGRLGPRFYTPIFLLAFEPPSPFRTDTNTWIRSRAAHINAQKTLALELLFARLLSLLAHHPDFSTSAEDLADFATYILFYLAPVATEENIGVIYHVAQRVKQARDAVVPHQSENLYYLSDLAQTIIRKYEDVQGWSMQTYPSKVRLPSALFAQMPSHDVAQEIAMKQYLPEGLDDQLDEIVRAKIRASKKRKSDPADASGAAKKRPKPSATSSIASPTMTTALSKKLPVRKTSSSSNSKPRTPSAASKAKARSGSAARRSEPPPSSERRRSGRNAVSKVNYAEDSDEEADGDKGVVNGRKRRGGMEEVDEDEEEGGVSLMDEDEDEE